MQVSYRADSAPTTGDSAKLKGALVKQLGVDSNEIKGWALTYVVEASRRRLVGPGQEQREYEEAMHYPSKPQGAHLHDRFVGERREVAGDADRQRRLSDSSLSYIWTSDFTIVAVMVNTTGTEYAASVANALNSSSFAATLATSLNTTTLAVDAGSFITDVSTRKPSAIPSPVPTAIPTILPTLSPTSVPTPLPFSAPTLHPTSVPTSECGAGYYGTGNLTNRCRPCQAGKFKNIPGGQKCTDCKSGKYSPHNANGTLQCSNCTVGTYADERGSIVCKECVAGKYSRKTNSMVESDCQVCEAGKIANSSGARNCQLCESGKYNLYDDDDATKHDDAADCSFCPPGEKSNAERTKCTSCIAGQYVDDTTGDCKNCSTGKC